MIHVVEDVFDLESAVWANLGQVVLESLLSEFVLGDSMLWQPAHCLGAIEREMGLERPQHVLCAGKTWRAELMPHIRRLAILIETSGSSSTPSCLLLPHFGLIHQSIKLLLQRCNILFEYDILYSLFTRWFCILNWVLIILGWDDTRGSSADEFANFFILQVKCQRVEGDAASGRRRVGERLWTSSSNLLGGTRSCWNALSSWMEVGGAALVGTWWLSCGVLLQMGLRRVVL